MPLSVDAPNLGESADGLTGNRGTTLSGARWPLASISSARVLSAGP
jgi:hypothetical protein